jgi:hypothetical protein
LTVAYTSSAPSLTPSDAGINFSGSSSVRTLFGTDPSSPFGAWIQTTNAVGSSFPISLNPLGGNVGIGTSSPGQKLQVAGNTVLNAGGGNTFLEVVSGSSAIQLATDGSTQFIYGTGAVPLTFSTNAAERMRIDSSGNVLIGTTTAFGKLNVVQSSDTNVAKFSATSYGLTLNSDAGVGFRIEAADPTGLSSFQPLITNGSIQIYRTGNNERMRIDSSGNLLVGTTSTANQHRIVGNASNLWALVVQNNIASNPLGQVIQFEGASPNGTANQFLYCGDSTALRAEIRSNGGIANYSGNDVNLSDAREKTNVELAGSYLNKICAIPVKTFNYIDQNLEEDGGLTLGVIAQDVESVAPELVMESDWSKEKDGSKMRLSIYQTDLQYALMKCIQEQQTLINNLTTRLNALEGK